MQANEITFAGYAGRDAEEVTTSSGTRIVKFSLCHTEKRDNGGDVSTWVTAVVFGNWCDLAAQVKKGDNVLVTGKLQVRTWEKDGGGQGYSVEVVARALGIFRKDERRSGAQRSGSSGKQQQGADQW